jgi:hypothetical protein
VPYKSEKQRKFMHARHPEIAKRWDAEYGSKVQPKKRVAKKATPKRRKTK